MVFVYKWQEKMYVVSDFLKKCFTCFKLLEISKCSSQNLCLEMWFSVEQGAKKESVAHLFFSSYHTLFASFL